MHFLHLSAICIHTSYGKDVSKLAVVTYWEYVFSKIWKN